MFLSYQTLYEQCQKLSSDDNSDTLILFKLWLNKGVGKCYKVLPTEWFYGTATDLTVDGTYSYPLPYNCDKIHTVKVTIGTVDYVVKEFPMDENQWIAMRGGTTSNAESAYPVYFFVKRNTIEFYPTPSTSAYTITYRYKKTVKDMTASDFTTESIKTATVGSTAIVGNTGTTWTAAMVGRYLRITDDGIWYEISAVPTSETITLAREFAGTAVVAGTAAYIIGEMSMLPEDYQDTPVNYALWQYYLQKKDLNMADRYKQNWLENLLDLKQSGGNQTTSGVLEEDVVLNDPNANPTLS